MPICCFIAVKYCNNLLIKDFFLKRNYGFCFDLTNETCSILFRKVQELCYKLLSVISSTWILLIFNKHYYQVQILNITTIHSIFIEWCFFFSLLLYVLHLILPYLICYFFCIFSLNLFYLFYIFS